MIVLRRTSKRNFERKNGKSNLHSYKDNIREFYCYVNEREKRDHKSAMLNQGYSESTSKVLEVKGIEYTSNEITKLNLDKYPIVAEYLKTVEVLNEDTNENLSKTSKFDEDSEINEVLVSKYMEREFEYEDETLELRNLRDKYTERWYYKTPEFQARHGQLMKIKGYVVSAETSGTPFYSDDEKYVAISEYNQTRLSISNDADKELSEINLFD